MTSSALQSELTTIDHAVITELVREALHDAVEIADWQVQQLHSGGSGSRIFRVTGEAHARGASVPWSLILKIFDLQREGFQAASEDTDAWDYWKREWLVYQAPWLRDLPRSIVAPRCLGAADHPGVAAWVALEDLQHLDQRPWSLLRFETVARHLGAFNGAYLAGQEMPTDAWLSHDWLRGWTERSASTVGLLPTVADQPLVRQIFSESTIAELLRLWEERHTFYDALQALPQTLCHLDIFPRNVFVKPTAHGDQSVAIDWAFCGRAAAGEELGALIGASLAFFEADPATAAELQSRCIRGYLDGLRETGWRGDDANVRFAAVTALALRFGIGALAPILAFTLDETVRSVVEQIFRRPFGEVIGNLRAVMDYEAQCIVEARRLLEAR